MAQLAALWAKLGKHWWARVVIIWAATRVIAAIGFAVAASMQGPTPWSPGHPAYFDFLDTWDSEWYRRIFHAGVGHNPGYGRHLPTFPDGSVKQNAWAFMPGFPMLVRLFTWLTGGMLEWKYLAAILSLVLSFALALQLYRLFALKLDAATALWGVTLFGLWCASPVLQTPYAESLALLLLASGLYYLIQHKYLAAVPWLVGLSITRPGMVSFAAMLGGMWLIRWWLNRKGEERFATHERWQLAGLTAISVLLGFAWPIFAWVITKRADAYTVTELAWRVVDPHAHLILFEAWIHEGTRWLGLVWAPLFLIVAMAGAALFIFSREMRAQGYELRLWAASYFFYLFAVFNPQSSTWRILMMAFPIWAAMAIWTKPWSTRAKTVLVVALIAAQFYWIHGCWVFEAPDITPP